MTPFAFTRNFLIAVAILFATLLGIGYAFGQDFAEIEISQELREPTGPAVVLTIETEAPPMVEVSDASRVPTPFEQNGNKYTIAEPGKHWVRVLVIDFANQKFSQKTVVVEVPDAPTPGPTPEPVEPPSAELQALVQPIKAKLASDESKAAKVVTTYAGFANAMRSKVAQSISSTSQFAAIHAAALQQLDVVGGVAVGSEIDAAVSQYVPIKRVDGGYENRTLTDVDRKRIAEVFDAVSWAGVAE